MRKDRPKAPGCFGILVAAALVGCGSPASSASAPSGPATAADACRATVEAGSWTVAVEIDGTERTTLAMTSGDDIALCSTDLAAEGSGSTDVGVGRHPIAAPPALTYSSSAGPSARAPSSLVGRVPAGAATVRVAFADGSEEAATVANGIWLAALERPATPIRIEARDLAGTIVGAIEDANGLQPSN